MAELSPERLAAQVAQEPLRPAYLVAGPEPLRVLEAADAVRVAAREQGIGEREVFEAQGNQREPDWDALHASFSAPSLFAGRRLLELRLPTAKPGKQGGEALCDFCAAPPQDVVLLVTGGDWSRQHGGKWSEAIARIGHVVIAWPVKPHELPEWVERRLRARGVDASRDAVARLCQRVDGNLLAAAQEIDKLALLADGQPFDLERLDAVVADSARYDVFRLVDAAMNGQPAQVSRMLAGLRAEGEAVPALLGMVVRELQLAAHLARVQAGGGNLQAACKSLRIWDSKQAAYLRALRRHPAERWERWLAAAGRVDRISKGRAPGDAWRALERVLLAVAEPRAAALA